MINTNKCLYETELDKLFSECITSVINKERLLFDQLVEPFNESIVLFGAGNLGRKTLQGLRMFNVEPLAFSDNNPELWNNKLDGISVLSPFDAAKKFGKRAAFIVTILNPNRRLMDTIHLLSAKLNCIRVASFIPLFWKYPEVFLPHCWIDLHHKIFENISEVKSTLSLFSDEYSCHEYVNQLKWRIQLDFDQLSKPISGEQYFPKELFDLLKNELFIDCGVFNGDTIRSFLKIVGMSSFDKIFCFEPDPLNFENLLKYVSTLQSEIFKKIKLYQLAVGSIKGKVYFDSKGISSQINNSGDVEVNCVPLDDVLYMHKPTFIKMDIEGSEIEAIMGSSNIIKKSNPILAVSIYHHQDHLWKIPLLINSINCNYNFFLRPYKEECWELVCYAIPDERLKI